MLPKNPGEGTLKVKKWADQTRTWHYFQHSHHVSVNNGLNFSPVVQFLDDRNPLLGHGAIREPLFELSHRWKISFPPFDLSACRKDGNRLVQGLDIMADVSIPPIENVKENHLLCAPCGVVHCRAGEQRICLFFHASCSLWRCVYTTSSVEENGDHDIPCWWRTFEFLPRRRECVSPLQRCSICFRCEMMHPCLIARNDAP